MGQQASDAANKAAAAASKMTSEDLKLPKLSSGDGVSKATPTKHEQNVNVRSPAAATPSKGGFKVENASKEELVDVLGKLHKRTRQIR